jgi:hypothetical protein
VGLANELGLVLVPRLHPIGPAVFGRPAQYHRDGLTSCRSSCGQGAAFAASAAPLVTWVAWHPR